MKHLTILSLIVIQFLSTTHKISQESKIDLAKSTVKWTGYAEAGNYAPSGNIKIKSGKINFLNETLKSISVEIDMGTLTHENKDLEKHLKDSDFFDCDKFPVATFISSEIKGNRINGQLTIKNITKAISFPIEVSKLEGVYVVKANLKVNRTLYNIKYNSSSFFQDLGNYAIKNDFDLSIIIMIKK